MPSSPSPGQFTRTPQRFFYRGIQLVPQDALGEGKVAYVKNMRSYQEGTLTPRYGLEQLTDSALPGPIHSVFRLNDTSLYGVSASARRFLGSGDGLYAMAVGGGAATQFSGLVFSGNPLTAVVASPFSSPRPYLYVGDSLLPRKFNAELNDYPIGIPTPIPPPDALLAHVKTSFLESIPDGTWVAYGASTPAGTPTTVPRVAGVVTAIVFDSGTTGFASVSLDDMEGIVAGATVDIGGETVIVQDVLPPVSPTTIGRIIYDSGLTGLCTIQPEGSFSVGQIEVPTPDEIRRRYEDLNLPVPPRVTITRTVDYPVNSLITLGGLETVKLLSIAIGQDGKQSFRCFTNNPFVATDTIVGLPTFRADFQTTTNVGDPASADAFQNTLTALNTTDPIVGGIKAEMVFGARNWALVGDVASQESDIIRLGVKVSQFAYLKSVRLMLNVSDDDGYGGGDFMHNYYFYEWRASDLLEAVASSVGGSTGLMADAQAGAVTQGQTDAQYRAAYGASTARGTGSAEYIAARRAAGPGPVEQEGGAARGTASAEYIARRWPTDGYVSTGSTPSRQMALGNDQWLILECRVGDLTRVGTDTTRTIGTITAAAMTMQIQGTTTPITCAFQDAYLTGGYGPDVGPTLPPYVYRYAYRSTLTGERSNPSPPMRAGVTPRRGRVLLTASASGAPQADMIDWFRFGGALARWQYTGSLPNDTSPPTFVDDNSDSDISGGETIRTDLFQPWPTADIPRSGIVELAGTALKWVSGDLFDTAWGEGSIVIVNGKATALYRQPESHLMMTVVDNCGEGAAVEWSMPSPTLLGTALPYIWGGPINGAWFNFACGNPSDPALLHWSNGNDPDSTSLTNSLIVSTASEPLQNGFFYDGVPYVFSTEQLFRIVPSFGNVSTFVAQITPCTKGLWSPWFMAVTDDGVYFGNKSGIYFTNGGTAAIPITTPDLQVLFPQDGTAAEAIRGLNPIDWTAIEKLKLTPVDGNIYFDYQDTEGEGHTLLYEPLFKRWTPDAYLESEADPPVPVGITARLGESGPQVHDDILCGADGHVYQYDLTKITDVQTTINWAVYTIWAGGDDPRAYKQWGDAILDMNPGRSIAGVTVRPVIDNGNTPLQPQILGASGNNVRDTYQVEVGAQTDTLGVGVLSRNFGLQITGGCQACDDQRPLLYLWEPAYLNKQVSTGWRATDWEDLGYKGQKFVQGVVIRANTFGQDKVVEIQFDGPNDGPSIGATLTINHDGERQIAYPMAAEGWAPFLAELVRMQGVDAHPWILLDWRFIWEPAPELATQWETQYTTFDYPGFLSVFDGVIAYQSTADVTWFVEYQDGSTATYTLTDSGGAYRRIRQICQPQKGKAVRFRWTSDEPFRLFKRDISVRVQPWGVPGGYQLQAPFGGPSRIDGAEI